MDNQETNAAVPVFTAKPGTANTAKIPEHPFERIALSCSGGGYRAASFHLGAM